MSYPSQYFFFCRVILGQHDFATITHFIYLFIYFCNSLFSHSEASTGVLTVWIFGCTRQLVFQKNSCSDNIWKISSKKSMMESFLSTFANHPGNFSKSRELNIKKLHEPSSLKKNSTENVSRIFKIHYTEGSSL